jgi:DNA invertase Pin-like site-specific DNA recombinase
MKIGYCRTSTVDQVAGLDNQVRELEMAGCERVYREQISSVAERPELERAIEYVRDGDVFVVSKIDRLARSIIDLHTIAERLRAKGVPLVILAMPALDHTTALGRAMFSLIGTFAELERDMMLERQRIGIAAAKAAGKYVGRQPTARRKLDDIRRLKASGIGCAQIAKELRIGRASVYRLLGEAEAA